MCVKRLKTEVAGHPSSGERVSEAATSKFGELWATDGNGEDVTLPELVQLMKWDHACKPHQSKPCPTRPHASVWSYEINKLNACLQDQELDYVSFQAIFSFLL